MGLILTVVIVLIISAVATYIVWRCLAAGRLNDLRCGRDEMTTLADYEELQK